MFIVRFLILAFLVALAWSMGKEPALNAFGTFVAFSIVVTAPALYLLPTYEAWRRHHGNLGALAALNVFLGWTLLGWVGALVWAFKGPEPVSVVAELQPTAPPAPTSSADQLHKLASLLDRGLLTPEEFAQQKAQVLADQSASKR